MAPASAVAALCLLLLLTGCSGAGASRSDGSMFAAESCRSAVRDAASSCVKDAADRVSQEVDTAASADAQRLRLNIQDCCYDDLAHGIKTAEFQKYIVLHDTEGEMAPVAVADWWESNGNKVAAHFVVGTDGTIVQCVPLDQIAHHVGFGDAGNNERYGTGDESRDDKVGTSPIGDAYPDYGMNSYSIGIELVHVGGSGDYPAAQLEALDGLIAYIDAYYGFDSTVIDHKAWRASNSDTSAEFAPYLASYQACRRHAAE